MTARRRGPGRPAAVGHGGPTTVYLDAQSRATLRVLGREAARVAARGPRGRGGSAAIRALLWAWAADPAVRDATSRALAVLGERTP